MNSLRFFVIFISLLCLFLTNSHADEVRIGIVRHDVVSNLKQAYEKGENINLEYLFNEQFKLFHAIPHIGTSINDRGYTNSIYAGLTWHLNIFKHFFIEASLGGGIHNGNLKKSAKKRALGSRLLFRESLSLGVKFNLHHSFSVILDHMSNASIVSPNPGLTGFGLRYGYSW